MFAVTLDANNYVSGFQRMTFAQFCSNYGRTPPDTVRFVDTPVFWLPEDVTDFLRNYSSFYFDESNVLRRDYST